MRRLLDYSFTCLISFFSITLFAQTDLPSVMPPSPEASALTRFTEVPVSHYTGIPDISIPIQTISARGIKIPITLRYHARGVKVSDVAPSTGTGWSLSYGGSISRQIRGKADDTAFPNGYLAHPSIFMNYSTNQNTRDIERMKSSLDPSFDYYPDQFSFDAGGVSGKFILSYVDQQPVIQSFGDTKINYQTENGKIASFIIKDSNGNTFYYGRSMDGARFARDSQLSSGKSIYHSRVVDDPPGAGESNIYTSWHLMDIQTATGDLISYFYHNPGMFTRYRKAYDMHDSDGNITNSVNNYQNIQSIHTRLSIINSSEYQLREIIYNKGKIIFTNQSTLREDYNGYALDKITIKDNDDVTVKGYKFNYAYTTSNDQTNILGYFKNGTEFANSFKRLFLTTIEEEGKNGRKLPPYKFTYDSTVLPSRFSTRQDYWGYYNGALNNGPFLRMFDYGNYTPDRSVDTLKSQAGLLLKIQYPTGGTTTFTYEDNIGAPPSYLPEVKIPNVNPISEPPVQIVLTKSDFFNPSTGAYEAVSLTFPCAMVSYNIQCFHFRPIDGDPNIPDCIFDFGMDNVTMQVGTSVNFSTCSDNTKVFRILPKQVSGVDPNLHLSNQYDFQIHLTYNNNTEPHYLYAGGKRIKKIENESVNGTTIREFEYYRPGTNITSGGVIGLPSFLERKENNSNIYQHYYDSDSSYGTFQPNAIGYSHVTEYYGTKEDNIGKTEYTFTNLSDSGGDYYKFPYHPPTDNEWLRGKNIRTKIFKKNQNDTYTLTKNIYNKYKFHNEVFAADFEYPGFVSPYFKFTPLGSSHDYSSTLAVLDTLKTRTLLKLQLFMPRRLTDVEHLNGLSNGYRLYHFTGGTVNLDHTIETDYFDNARSIIKTTNYFYTYDRHYQVSKTETSDSNDKIVSNINYFPIDILEGLTSYPTEEIAAVDTLFAQNRFEVVKLETKKNDTLLSTVNNLYHNNSLALPKVVQDSKGTNALKNRIEYHGYDNRGNPLVVSRTDGIKTVFIWGYNKQYPIAKIENVTYAQVQSFESNLQALSNADNDNCREVDCTEQQLREALKTLRTSLPSAKISSYTYDPLIGVTSMTDPKGYTVYYEYDGFNRLEYVKDDEGNILSENEYHYREQM